MRDARGEGREAHGAGRGGAGRRGSAVEWDALSTERIDAHRYRSTRHSGGAWSSAEIHFSPLGDLIVRAIDRHLAQRPETAVTLVAGETAGPLAAWIALVDTVVFGTTGQGATSTVLHDVAGPVGFAHQSLTIRPTDAR